MYDNIMNNKKIGFIFPAFAMKFTGTLSMYQDEVDELSSLASRHVPIDLKRFEEMTAGVIEEHPFLATLGPEPLNDDFNAEYLYRRSRKRESRPSPAKRRVRWT